ncbi:PIN domain-containing protein [Chitinimonas sp.]|uniref:PIN domain-containing protein n=1 Tax=Chitinimonas sp. TaxID=1934313 RepID=UPI002F9558DE
MRTNYVLIDYENVPAQSLHLLQDEHFRVIVFLGPHNIKLRRDFVLAMHQLGPRSQYITLETAGTNALDFHIAYYLGNLATGDPMAYFHVISKDTGFDPLLQHLQGKKIACARSPSIEEMPCFTKPAVTKTLAKDSATDAPAPAKVPTIEDHLRASVDDLISRKQSKPRTIKTLKRTIQAKLGKTVAPETTDQVYNLLIKQKLVKIAGEKVTYTLPTIS